MTYYGGGGGLYDGEALRGYRDQSVSKLYYRNLDILKGGFDWDAYEDAVSWLSTQLGDRGTNIQVVDTDGNLSARSVRQARDHVEAERTEVQRIACHLSDPRRRISASIIFDSPPNGPIRVRVESEDQERMLGFAERLRLHVERGGIRGASASTVVEYDVGSTEGPSLRRRLPAFLSRKGLIVTVSMVALVTIAIASQATETLLSALLATATSTVAALLALAIARRLWPE